MKRNIKISIADIVIQLNYSDESYLSSIPKSFIVREESVDPHIRIYVNQNMHICPIPLKGDIIKTPGWDSIHNSDGYCFNILDKSVLLATLRINTDFSEAYIETIQMLPETGLPYTCVLTPIILGYLFHHNIGFMFHGAAVSIGENCIVLTGASGVGKSTLSALLDKAGFAKYADDRLIITCNNNGTFCHSTPFDLKLSSWMNKSAKIQAVLSLHHSTTDRNFLLKKEHSLFVKKGVFSNFAPLFATNWLPTHYQLYAKAFSNIPVYDYHFVPNETAVKYLQRKFRKK